MDTHEVSTKLLLFFLQSFKKDIDVNFCRNAQSQMCVSSIEMKVFIFKKIIYWKAHTSSKVLYAYKKPTFLSYACLKTLYIR